MDLETGFRQGVARPRTRRFQRRPRRLVPRVAITERDVAILRLVHEHRFLRSSHIVSHLTPGRGRENLLRRLRRLYDSGFLDRPEEQWGYRSRAGAEPMVYALGDEGAAFLEDRFDIPRARTRLRDRNREVKERHVRHCLLVADVMLAFERTARRRGNVRVISPREILKGAPDAVRAEPRPFQWQVAASWEGETLKLPVMPDKLFGLEFVGAGRAWFMLEADRGTETTMPVDPKNTRKPTIFHKCLAYHATHEQGLLAGRYGAPLKVFRVLTVTTGGAGRIASMREAATRASGGRMPDRYLFAEQKHLLECADVLAMEWQHASGGTDVLDL